MDAAQFGEVAVGGSGIGAVGGLVVGFEGTWEFAKAIVGAAEDIPGAHPFVGVAMTVEILH